MKNLKLKREQNQREKRKFEKEETTEAKEGFKLKTDLDHYKKHIYDHFKEIDFTGLNTYQKKLPLEKVYIRLKAKENYKLEDYKTIFDFEKLKEEVAEKKSRKKTPAPETTFTDTFFSLSTEAGQKKQALKMLVLGHPGSGKTTLFKWIALQCVLTNKGYQANPFSKYIPFFISLKDFAKNPDWLKNDIIHLITQKFRAESVDVSFFKDRFERSEIIFLLDGLDEVADENIRRDAIAWIEKQHIRNNRLLVSSRFSGLNPHKGLFFKADFRAFIIQDLNDADIEQFLYRWYEAIETVVDDSESNREVARKQAGELVEIFKKTEHQALRNIAVNPLLLTIVAIVHRNRARIPNERHKLYEECLNVMIESWNQLNKKLYSDSFPAEVCKNNLAILARHAMEENKREITKLEIDELLPDKIEGKPRSFFLNEMVLKAGLLYESEGKFGFLHLTFQEYLAAYAFAHSSKPLEILDYRDKDYWTDTIKLFVNVGNKQQFFDEILAGLDEKYWQNMNLWESCLRDEMIDEEIKNKFEIRFAQRVAEILLQIPFEESEEEKIVQLFPHYPLYTHAQQIEDLGWLLFEQANHPFCKSIGASVLNRCHEETRDQMYKILRRPIPTGDALYQIMEFDNLTNLLLAGRDKIIDFISLISRLKESGEILKIKILLDLQYLPDLPAFSYLLGFIDYLELLNLQYLSDLRNLPYLQDLRYLPCLWDLNYFQNVEYLRNWVHLRDLRDLENQFEHKYKLIIQQHQAEINNRANQALQKLQDLNDEEILKSFPNSTPEEIEIFRSNHPPKILQEIKKGNNQILANPLLTTETLEEVRELVDRENAPDTFYQILTETLAVKYEDEKMSIYKKEIIKWLTEKQMLKLTEGTIHFLLGFHLNTNRPEDCQIEIEAMKYLRKMDYATWRDMLALATQERDGEDDRWVNALYVFKLLN